MLVTILWRMEEQPVVNYAMTFEDVAADPRLARGLDLAEGEIMGQQQTMGM